MSKFTLYDWRCTNESCGIKFEQMEKPDVKTTTCPSCSAEAKRLISAVRFDWMKMGRDPDFRSFGDKWAKANQQKVRQDRAFHKEHGADKKHHSFGS